MNLLRGSRHRRLYQPSETANVSVSRSDSRFGIELFSITRSKEFFLPKSCNSHSSEITNGCFLR